MAEKKMAYTFYDTPEEPPTIEDDITLDDSHKYDINGGEDFSFGFDKMDENVEIPMAAAPVPKRKTKSNNQQGTLVTEGYDDKKDKDLPQALSNRPYIETFNETDALLHTAINQLDSVTLDINQQLQEVKNSRVKGKYTHIQLLGSTMSSLLSSKINAIKEINNTIVQSHNLDLKRIKETNVSLSKDTDEKVIMDMYNAFISAPGLSNTLPSVSPLSPQQMSNGILSGINTPSLDSYVSNSKQMTNMIANENPNLETVVFYDKNSGRKWFDVMDTTTGQSAPMEIDRPNAMFLEDCKLDFNAGMAINTNLRTSYKLISIDNGNISSKY